MSGDLWTPVTDGDFDALADFLSAGLGAPPSFWKSRFSRWWEANPAFTEKTPRGWVLPGGRGVEGFLGNVPGRMAVAGQPLTAYAVTSWLVAQNRRAESLSPLLRLAAEAETAKTLLFDSTPTGTVAVILDGLGFRRYPWGGDRESLLIFDCPGLSGILLRAAQTVLRRGGAVPSGYECGEAAPGPWIDELWNRTRRLYNATNERALADVSWQCDDPQTPKRLLRVEQDGRPVGYAQFRPRTRRGLPCLDCVDLWLDPSAPAALEAALAATSALARDCGAALASFPHFSATLGRRLRRMGLLSRYVPARGRFTGPAALVSACDPESSYFCALQGDQATALP